MQTLSPIVMVAFCSDRDDLSFAPLSGYLTFRMLSLTVVIAALASDIHREGYIDASNLPRLTKYVAIVPVSAEDCGRHILFSLLTCCRLNFNRSRQQKALLLL